MPAAPARARRSGTAYLAPFFAGRWAKRSHKRRDSGAQTDQPRPGSQRPAGENMQTRQARRRGAARRPAPRPPRTLPALALALVAPECRPRRHAPHARAATRHSPVGGGAAARAARAAGRCNAAPLRLFSASSLRPPLLTPLRTPLRPHACAPVRRARRCHRPAEELAVPPHVIDRFAYESAITLHNLLSNAKHLAYNGLRRLGLDDELCLVKCERTIAAARRVGSRSPPRRSDTVRKRAEWSTARGLQCCSRRMHIRSKHLFNNLTSDCMSA
jgi:hypothetical protein